MEHKILKNDDLKLFIENLINSGSKIIAPKKKGNKYFFSVIKSFDEIVFDYVQTTLSAKSVVFPRVDVLMKYIIEDGKPKVEPLRPEGQEMIVFGLKPCDAVSLEYMSRFFLDDDTDNNILQRSKRTTFISLSCKKCDEFCFCTSVGLNPGITKGSDIQITEIDNGNFFTEVLTDKGDVLIKENASIFHESSEINKEKFIVNPETKFDIQNLTKQLPNLFEDNLWLNDSLVCLGCGSCAFSCPTCTCFDIQDSGNPYGGIRYRTWDTCSLPIFTQHTTGHNPRPTQSQRWRQRIMHKFDYSVKNHDMISCVGCGRCMRNCPTQMNILEQIENIISVKKV